jgi:hypothetical protein
MREIMVNMEVDVMVDNIKLNDKVKVGVAGAVYGGIGSLNVEYYLDVDFDVLAEVLRKNRELLQGYDIDKIISELPNYQRIIDVRKVNYEGEGGRLINDRALDIDYMGIYPRWQQILLVGAINPATLVRARLLR